MNGSRLTGSAILVFALSTGAASAVANDRGVAVIVGNKDYAEVEEVPYAHNDAEAFKRFVTGRLGFDSDNVIDLRDATKSQLEAAFGVKGNAKGRVWRYIDPEGGSDVVVFYSGHGVPGKAGRGYLLPVDSNPDTAELNGYSIDLLYENLGGLPARSKTVFLDACFSGGSPSGRMLIRSASPVYVEADVSGGEGLTVLTAASGTQLASWDEEARHGLFTEHLLDGLYGAADADGDGRVTAREAKLHLDETMTHAARREFGRVQDAGLHGDRSAVLSSAPADGWGTRPLLGPPPAAFTVVVEPAEARVRLPGHGETYQPGMLLPPGSYRVEASAEGYEKAAESVSHGAGPTVHRMTLRKAGPRPGDSFRDCAECPEMVVVPAGSYRMGSPSYEQGRDEDEGPKHEVTISAPFAIGRYEVTVAEFERFVDAAVYSAGNSCMTYEDGEWEGRERSWHRPGFRQSGRFPVVCVSWNDAQAYAARLSRQTGKEYRLPSESEWEYAARAGSETLYHFGNDASELHKYGKYGYYNGADTTKPQSGHSRLSGVQDQGLSGVQHQGYAFVDQATDVDQATERRLAVAAYPMSVGHYDPNNFGLHDMHGNVWEWVKDCWNSRYDGAPTDGSAWESRGCGPRRVLRGGSWLDGPSALRAANRGTGKQVTTDFRGIYVGFRVARTLAP